MNVLCKCFFWLVCLNGVGLQAQGTEWPNKPVAEWPQIALINEVWYQGGERYVHPSFAYAASGFLLDTGKDTLAVTAKHVLWIAKASTMDAVDLQGKLERWIMRPKGNSIDSVVIGELLNVDATEKLNGPDASITQRDWLVFTTKYVDPDIKPLKIRSKPLKTGERLWITGCPYRQESCFIEATQALEIEGSRIVFAKPAGLEVGGASGSPILDRKGRLVGIIGGGATSKLSGENELYGTSVRYLEKVLKGEVGINQPLVPISDWLEVVINQKGIEGGIRKFEQLKRKRKAYFSYDFSPEAINKLALRYAEAGKPDFAISIFKLSLQELPLSGTWVALAKVYNSQQNLAGARQACQKALALWPENEEAMKLLEALKQ